MNEYVKELKENIKRLKHTISCIGFQPGYIENCKAQLKDYEYQLNVMNSGSFAAKFVLNLRKNTKD